MTPFTRYLVTKPEKQRTERASHRQMDTPSSLGCMLSHIRCLLDMLLGSLLQKKDNTLTASISPPRYRSICIFFTKFHGGMVTGT